MQDYARRHLGFEAAPARRSLNRRVARLTRMLRRSGSGQLSVQSRAADDSVPVLALSLRGLSGLRLRRMCTELGALLLETPARLTLRFEHVSRADVPRVRRLLSRLRRFADRISIEAGAHVPPIPNAWAFRLQLPGLAISEDAAS
jgi:hypothetical protein